MVSKKQAFMFLLIVFVAVLVTLVVLHLTGTFKFTGEQFSFSLSDFLNDIIGRSGVPRR